MASQDKPEKKTAAHVTARDFEQEYLYSKLKFNKRALSGKYSSNKPELDLAKRKSRTES